MLEPGLPGTREWFLYECLFPAPEPCYLLRILTAFFMMGLFPTCHRLGFIHSANICQEPFILFILAACQLRKNLVISALFFLPYKSVLDPFVLSPSSGSQFQIIYSRRKTLARLAEDSNLGSFFFQKRIWHNCLHSLDFKFSIFPPPPILKFPRYYYYLQVAACFLLWCTQPKCETFGNLFAKSSGKWSCWCLLSCSEPTVVKHLLQESSRAN